MTIPCPASCFAPRCRRFKESYSLTVAESKRIHFTHNRFIFILRSVIRCLSVVVGIEHIAGYTPHIVRLCSISTLVEQEVQAVSLQCHIIEYLVTHLPFLCQQGSRIAICERTVIVRPRIEIERLLVCFHIYRDVLCRVCLLIEGIIRVFCSSSRHECVAFSVNTLRITADNHNLTALSLHDGYIAAIVVFT